ncbi:MFS transporter [Echinicola marina]|uniref:MFS transporter n=1 Tax=Echinicola marina TaxID=2859768 RepID=UPI001CF6F5DE|nr:MFS transporter [Echinicola marina]UCS94703.1 MFS transporter [Echinicola marina]
MKPAKRILPLIVFSQFCCTSIWFASNAVMGSLLESFDLSSTALGHLTSAVQLGFIFGTLIFALLSVADRFSPSRVFLFCAVLGGLFNLGLVWPGNTLVSLIVMRFLAGLCLAGIYPVGMKIAADYYEHGLGKSLGFLVGALVLGTAFPHFLQAFIGDLSWVYVIIFISALAVLGGFLIGQFVPDGPYRKAAAGLDLSAIFKVFRIREFSTAAIGYFGHMWELYAFWAFVPFILVSYGAFHPHVHLDISLWSFLIIGMGSLGCILAGYLYINQGAKKIASMALAISGLCCLVSPLIFLQPSPVLLIIFLLIWGLAVVADSPLFSTMVAQNAPADFKGTALTIVNSLGFALTIFSIQLLNYFRASVDVHYLFIVLAVGPAVGLSFLWKGKS